MTLGRFILRLVVVPLGALFAICASVIVLVLAHWNVFSRALDAPDLTQDQFFAAVAFAPVIFFLLVSSGVLILLPAAIGVLIAEAFSIRSWMFHVSNGMLSAWIGWYAAPRLNDAYPIYGDPRFIVVAGAAAGLVYWLIAGRGAGANRAPPQPQFR